MISKVLSEMGVAVLGIIIIPIRHVLILNKKKKRSHLGKICAFIQSVKASTLIWL